MGGRWGPRSWSPCRGELAPLTLNSRAPSALLLWLRKLPGPLHIAVKWTGLRSQVYSSLLRMVREPCMPGGQSLWTAREGDWRPPSRASQIFPLPSESPVTH